MSYYVDITLLATYLLADDEWIGEIVNYAPVDLYPSSVGHGILTVTFRTDEPMSALPEVLTFLATLAPEGVLLKVTCEAEDPTTTHRKWRLRGDLALEIERREQSIREGELIDPDDDPDDPSA